MNKTEKKKERKKEKFAQFVSSRDIGLCHATLDKGCLCSVC